MLKLIAVSWVSW